jgi:hypothetical protein
MLTMAGGSSAAIAQASHSSTKSPATGGTASAGRASHAWFTCFRTGMAQGATTQAALQSKYPRILKRCAHRPPTTTVPTVPAPAKPTTPAPTEPTTPTPAKPTTPAPTTPAPTTPAPSGGIASAASTGVPSGISLEAASGLNITKDGTVVDGKNISGGIWIDADNVTVKNSRISGNGFAVVQVKDGSKGVKISNVEIDGKAAQSGSMGVIGPADVTGADIKGVENGLTPGSGSVLTNNWVHDLQSPGSPHYDGIQIDGGLSNITITKNRIDLSNHTQTSAVMIDNYFGPISNIVVDGNHLSGGGYTVYSDGQFTGGSIAGVSFTNNVLGKGYYGYASVVKNSPAWSGNTDAETGKPVNR